MTVKDEMRAPCLFSHVLLLPWKRASLIVVLLVLVGFLKSENFKKVACWPCFFHEVA